MPNKKTSKWRKILRRTFYIFAFICVAFCIFFAFVEELYEYTPPHIENLATKLNEYKQVIQKNNYTQIGNSWSKKEQELLLLHAHGDPFAIGYTSGKLVGQIAPKLEDALLQRVEEIVGSTSLIWMFRKVGYVIYSDLQNYFSNDILQEVYGYSLAVPDKHPELGSSYFRALNYQAAHDTGHRVLENVLSLQGCTSFAAWGESTLNGHLIIGRNFDFEIGDVFDRFKIVQVVVPQKGIPFLSVSWPGMSGVVSGVNKEMLAVTINAGKSDHAKWKATPVTIVVRKILQEAKNIQEAIAILKNSQTYVSESFLIADGKNNEVAIVEKSPEITRIRHAKHFSQALVCSNHFLNDDFQTHKNHNIFVKEGSSPKRLERMRELISKHQGQITPQITATILRDTKLKNEKEIGLSHLHSINPSICSHSVILDLTDGIIWVNSGPNQSGRYLPISIKSIFEQQPHESFIINEKIIEADPLVSPKKVAQLISWRQNIKLWVQKKAPLDKIVTEMRKLNPQHFLTIVAEGDLYFQNGQLLQAKQKWQSALKSHPYGEWVTDIQNRIEKIGDKKHE
ncbi:C45 family autoproteolytic acyltransferase/hydolase [Candidatus Uabimicrobium sp. HlEnr_7]|uniref:C45 family autoproteolytic acyltransferase/hydolase n=1 Tax=Candidatus Uabimicrobium helgolandensis TaxID=3095367 RepID=UPI0035563998